VGGATREYYLDVVREATRLLSDEGVDHLVIGGAATRVTLGLPLNEAEDLDVFIRREDAERLLDVFARAGFATSRRDERWIFKAAKPDVTIDLIFRAGETIGLDETHLARSTTVEVDDMSFPIPAPEDLVVMKAVFDADDRQGRWYGALSILRQREIDWDYLEERGSAYAPRRILSLVLYATDLGLEIPVDVISRLVAVATAPAR
jgi:predicted nucleotidyltransferase